MTDDLRALAEAVIAGDGLAADNWARPEPTPQQVIALLDELEFLHTDYGYRAWDERHAALFGENKRLWAKLDQVEAVRRRIEPMSACGDDHIHKSFVLEALGAALADPNPPADQPRGLRRLLRIFMRGVE